MSTQVETIQEPLVLRTPASLVSPAKKAPEQVEGRTPASSARKPQASLWSRIKWVNMISLTMIPLIALYGATYTPLQTPTMYFCAFLYFFSMIGITGGSHRLYSHRSYNASVPLQLFLLAGGASALQGSAFWWAREHRAHHRYTDTELDPHSGEEGFFWTHVGWILFKREARAGPTDVRDLRRNKLLMFQHRHFLALSPVFALVLPTVIPGYFWGDWAGGFYYAFALRLTVAHHSTFCINSMAHYFGDAPFDDKHTPRNHFFTALVTMGEGYHNFHHQFPIDYRNAIKWYQYDPTKWFIAASGLFGLATDLQTFPENEIRKGTLTMSLRKLKAAQDEIQWPARTRELPLVTWEDYQEQSKTKPLILVNGYIHDLTGFEQKHPGGRRLLVSHVGKDASVAFGGGVYDHSNAARNWLAMMRVGVLDGGVEHVKTLTPAERLRIVEQARNGGVEPLTPVVPDV